MQPLFLSSLVPSVQVNACRQFYRDYLSFIIRCARYRPYRSFSGYSQSPYVGGILARFVFRHVGVITENKEMLDEIVKICLSSSFLLICIYICTYIHTCMLKNYKSIAMYIILYSNVFHADPEIYLELLIHTIGIFSFVLNISLKKKMTDSQS